METNFKFFLEKGLRDFFFLDFLWAPPQIINGCLFRADIKSCEKISILNSFKIA